MNVRIMGRKGIYGVRAFEKCSCFGLEVALMYILP